MHNRRVIAGMLVALGGVWGAAWALTVAVPALRSASVPPDSLVVVSARLAERIRLVTGHTVLGEQELQASARREHLALVDPADPAATARAGTLLGVAYVLAGRADRVGDRLLISLNLIEVRDALSVLELSEVAIGGTSALEERLPGYAGQIAAVLPKATQQTMRTSESPGPRTEAKSEAPAPATPERTHGEKATSMEHEAPVKVCVGLSATWLLGSRNEFGPGLSVGLQLRGRHFVGIEGQCGLPVFDAHMFMLGGGAVYAYGFRLAPVLQCEAGVTAGFWYEYDAYKRIVYGWEIGDVRNLWFGGPKLALLLGANGFFLVAEPNLLIGSSGVKAMLNTGVRVVF